MLIAPGVPAALAGAVIAWLRYRTTDVTCTCIRPDGTKIEIAARRVKPADVAGLRALVGELSAELAAGSGEIEGGSGSPTVSGGE